MSFQLTDTVTNKIKKLISNYFSAIPASSKKVLPEILHNKEFVYLFYATPQYLVVSFLSQENRGKVDEFIRKGYEPFPGLIARQNKVQSAFDFNNSKNCSVIGCNITDMFSFAKGKDSTILLQDHVQNINTKDANWSYKIDLAYIIFFGEEIDETNYLDFLQQVVAFSLSRWKLKQ
ncbi:hypothetical protein A2291_07755 [candidate division WOR-1 bacterium RIFOXYB2_FULL_42_35]|uniref:Uncharacterized protein n=1 Tax=candidate division WOR-1 bacterium RIFOXYC2_FULL_41_25 TaxID=1802586 RepID=A0A1F4TJ53_UNCSA|nr:MAG: hypothetical protein A2247_08280 [candidate division WOR-1 bacterium RIFOXYA2_FULL_41_14]OGC21816.1 MAG: hypothetical protein A2291_07755 [candidate division WOR-1 bacterium RIFOXYB2_FULL_42_35]OGC32714.1 MAG: hypothetical protein A2462_04145 [candidate division WOR-1 bacterium RIFOXYC2_FULL_41_25]OGC44034.1 MAG: hypothetical protein A2548_00325 [candidate division WOR-1 bacterium RIFOXYD2_FULL_41_8]